MNKIIDVEAIRMTAGATKPLSKKTPEEIILGLFDPHLYRLELSVIRELYTDDAIRECLTEKAPIEMRIEDVVLTGGSFEDRRIICGDTYEYELCEELNEELDPEFDGVYEFECGTTLVVTASEAFRVTPTLKDKIIQEYGITPVAV